MPLTMAQIALIDIVSDRIITLVGTMKAVPGMTQEEVDAETAKWQTVADDETDKILDRQDG